MKSSSANFCALVVVALLFATAVRADIAAPRDPTLEVCQGKQPGDACAFRCGDCSQPSDDDLPCYEDFDCSPAAQARGQSFGTCSENLQCTNLVGPGENESEGEGDGGVSDTGDDSGASCGSTTNAGSPIPLVVALFSTVAAVLLRRQRARESRE